MGDATSRSVVSAGYAPLDIVSYDGAVWHSAGGTAGNVAAILGFLGWAATLVGPVGDDLAGAAVRSDLQLAGVTMLPAQPVQGFKTPRILHEIVGGSHRYRYSCPECAQRLPSSRPLTARVADEVLALCSAPSVFFFDRLNAGTIRLAERFAQEGSVIVFEPSRPARPDLTDRALAIADVVKQAEDRSDALSDSGGRPGQIWVQTGGTDGSRYRIGRGIWHDSPAFSYPVVDPGGAGDWTTAGLLHALSPDSRWTVSAIGDALRWAQALAAVSCGSPGARGLAKHRSAHAVLAAATSLEERRAARDAEVSATRLQQPEAPSNACGWCLLRVESTASSVVA